MSKATDHPVDASSDADFYKDGQSTSTDVAMTDSTPVKASLVVELEVQAWLREAGVDVTEFVNVAQELGDGAEGYSKDMLEGIPMVITGFSIYESKKFGNDVAVVRAMINVAGAPKLVRFLDGSTKSGICQQVKSLAALHCEGASSAEKVAWYVPGGLRASKYTEITKSDGTVQKGDFESWYLSTDI
jgi:hypothetical protein